MKGEVNTEALQDIYASLANILGEEQMLLLWDNFKGVQLNMPAHLYNSEKVKQLISSDAERDPRKLAVRYGYSEKWVRSVLRTVQGGRNGE